MKINFINSNLISGSPIDSRITAFKKFFTITEANKFDKAEGYTFISMPPFRNFKYFFNQKNKIILDIRDGWSIAQKTGYGGLCKKKPFKSIITRIIERLMIRHSYLTITCTNGLQKYLRELSGKEILLIPNGVSDEDYDLAQKLKKQKQKDKAKKELVFCCAGQFSEYGIDKVKKLCNTIINRYSGKKILIQLIGTNQNKNKWLTNYLNTISNDVHLEILPKMNREELYKTINNADFGMTILRDPAYEFGTKIYDYIALGLPVVNYFEEPNNFTRYFDPCLDIPFNKSTSIPEIRRSKLIELAFKEYKQ